MDDSGRKRPHLPLSRRGLLFGGLVTGGAAFAALPGGTAPVTDSLPRSATGRPLLPGPQPTPARHTVPPARSAPGPPATAVPDPAEVRANELGLVPVMMYHRIQPRITGEYDMTPADFRQQLRTLFGMGMRPARTIDLVRGDFQIPAGYTPVVLTFDDGYANQFAVDAAGNVDPHSGVGILLEVCREFPDCTPAGSLNVNKNPFGLMSPAEQRRGLSRLHELGFEIANHTFNHDDLSRLDPAAIGKDLVRLQRVVEDAVPGASVLTMALPYGIPPSHLALLRKGSWHGETYRNEGVLQVGASPSASPFDASFDPLRIPRIRASSWNHGKDPLTARYWISYLKAHRHQLYVAAGNPGSVTTTKAAARLVAARYRHQLVTY